MRCAVVVGVVFLAGCMTPLEQGSRLYQDGDQLGALEVWRAVPEGSSGYEDVSERIALVETEFQRLVVQYKQRGRYHEDKDRLAESILDYRLALELQPGDGELLDHVQQLARVLAAAKVERKVGYKTALADGNLPEARRVLEDLRALDPFDPELETDARQLHAALRLEVDRSMEEGQRGFAAGNYSVSTRAFRYALELEPDNESARGYLSYIATIRRETRLAGSRPAAFEATDTIASDAQIRAEGFYQNALASEEKGDFFAAIRHDLRSVGADRDHAQAQRQLRRLRARLSVEVDDLIEAGRAAFREEDLQSALDIWRQALLVDPSNERTRAYIRSAEQQLQNLERLRSEPDVAARRR